MTIRCGELVTGRSLLPSLTVRQALLGVTDAYNLIKSKLFFAARGHLYFRGLIYEMCIEAVSTNKHNP